MEDPIFESPRVNEASYDLLAALYSRVVYLLPKGKCPFEAFFLA